MCLYAENRSECEWKIFFSETTNLLEINQCMNNQMSKNTGLIMWSFRICLEKRLTEMKKTKTTFITWHEYVL